MLDPRHVPGWKFEASKVGLEGEFEQLCVAVVTVVTGSDDGVALTQRGTGVNYIEFAVGLRTRVVLVIALYTPD